MVSKNFYITTSIMYTNGPPHIGFVLELLQADAIARYRRMMGDEVRFLTGTDEHGTKVARTAEAAGMEPQLFVDDIAAQVRSLAEKLNISNTDFIRTTDRERHWPSVRKLWKTLAENGDLYKKEYKGYYCVGHEAFMKPSELEDGRCPLHKTPTELIKEENWFFRLTKYKDDVKELIESGKLSILPSVRIKELLNLLDDAEDVSFSRPKSQLSWGIPVPDDPEQVMYVWADALTNYISALDFDHNSEVFNDFWPADVHLVGKDILRFHAMIWPAMLLSAGLDTPKAIYVHGFINVEGQKMSKSLGNVIEPAVLLEKHSLDVVRYYLLREIPSTDDGDFSWQNIERRYESELANSLGNLVQRLSKLISATEEQLVYHADMTDEEALKGLDVWEEAYHRAMNEFRIHDAVGRVWSGIDAANAYLNLYEPWKQKGTEKERTLLTVSALVTRVTWLLQPFMPETAEKIFSILGIDAGRDIAENTVIVASPGSPLFPKVVD